jgi:hypothetical protein
VLDDRCMENVNNALLISLGFWEIYVYNATHYFKVYLYCSEFFVWGDILNFLELIA